MIEYEFVCPPLEQIEVRILPVAMRLALLFIVGSVVAAENDPAGNDHANQAEPVKEEPAEPVKEKPAKVEDKPPKEAPPQPPKKPKPPAAERIQAAEQKLEDRGAQNDHFGEKLAASNSNFKIRSFKKFSG